MCQFLLSSDLYLMGETFSFSLHSSSVVTSLALRAPEAEKSRPLPSRPVSEWLFAWEWETFYWAALKPDTDSPADELPGNKASQRIKSQSDKIYCNYSRSSSQPNHSVSLSVPLWALHSVSRSAEREHRWLRGPAICSLALSWGGSSSEICCWLLASQDPVY